MSNKVFISFVIPEGDTELLRWYHDVKKQGLNISSLIREAVRQSITKEPPKWFLDWIAENGKIQPSIEVDLGGLFDD